MKPALIPALVMFAGVAVGLVAVRGQMAPSETTGAGSAGGQTVRVASAEIAAPHTARLRKENDGHYWTTAKVNGTPVRFLVDSGASVVALTTRDARRIGLNPNRLPRNAEVTTASDKVMAASVMLGRIAIDGVSVDDVQAVVIDDGLEQSLLGMSFLNQLKGWEATPTAIVIRGK